MKACLLGSIGVLVESSRLQRIAYNEAFKDLGLDAHWNVATYCRLLETPGGLRRLDFAFGDEWPVGLTEEVHTLKHKHFDNLISDGLELRPGVAQALEFCHTNEIPVAWVTTTTVEMLDSLFRYTRGLDRQNFALICSKDDVEAEKPDPAVYRYALNQLGVSSGDAIAVEDTPVNQGAALAADLQCYLYPGDYAFVERNILVTRDLEATVKHAHGLWSVGDSHSSADLLEPATTL
ncbi:MAG: HAD family hydrolase [Pseudomonadota bacterium]